MRFVKKNLCFLVSLACWSAMAVVPAVSRQFSATRVGPEDAIQVTIEVAFPENVTLPKVWLLTEHWPSGWTIEQPQWNNQPYPSTALADHVTQGWLFGEAGKPPVSDGTLTYILHAPKSFSSSMTMNTADGAVFTYNDSHYIEGSTTLRPDEYTQVQSFSLTIPPGWSLMALPYEVDDVSREMLEVLVDAIVRFNCEELSFGRSGFPPMGMPFWLHNPWEEEIIGEFTATDLDRISEPLRPAGFVRHQQWNLFGVCGEDPVRLANGVIAWRWRTNGYERCEENVILQPGEAILLFVE